MDTMQVSDKHVPSQPERIDINLQFASITQKLTTFKSNIGDLQQELKMLEKNIKKDVKETKKTDTIKLTKPLEKNIGFDNHEKITDELFNFMKLSTDVKTSTRNIVTKYITDYIQINKLQDMSDRKRINANKELIELFNLGENESLTFFNLHKNINKLFI